MIFFFTKKKNVIGSVNDFRFSERWVCVEKGGGDHFTPMIEKQPENIHHTANVLFGARYKTSHLTLFDISCSTKEGATIHCKKCNLITYTGLCIRDISLEYRYPPHLPPPQSHNR